MSVIMLRRGLRTLRNGQWLFCSMKLNLHTSSCPILQSKFDKDLPNPNLPTPLSKAFGPDKDILLDQLRKSRSIDKVLELTDMHLNVMNSKHVVTCLHTIHGFIKDDPILARDLLENRTFQSLCSRLMKVIRLFEPQEVITTYKLLCSLQVRSNTYVMQCVLKMLGAHLNNMSLGQLTFLNFLLHKQRHNSLVDGLRLALPLVLQVQIDQQLDSDNITDVVNCLQLSCRSRLKTTTIEKVMNAVVKKVSLLSTEEAVTVIFALLNLDTPVDGYKELISCAFEMVSKNIEDLNQHKILSILSTCRSQCFYDSKFFFAVADYIVSKNWNLESTYLALTYFYRLDFFPDNLLDHFAEVLCSESEQYKTKEFFSPLNCIEYLTATCYKPALVDEAARILYSDKKIQNFIEKHPNLIVKFLYCLSILGHFPPHLLPKALDEDFLYSAWSACRKQGRGTEYENNLISLSWSLEIYDKQKNFSIPALILNKFIQSVQQKHINTEYPLVKFIENGLGGAQFVQSGVFTRDGHVIDHIVAMRSGNYPVSLQNRQSNEKQVKFAQEFSFVEDIILPEDAKIIAIIVAREEHYCRDPEILKGWMDLKVRSLAKKNYSTVVVNYTLWKDLPDREKIPFLMRGIKQAVHDDCILKTRYS